VTPTATTRVAAVIGTPIRHSLSPAIYNAAYRALGLDWLFVAFDVPAGESEAAVRAISTLGLVGMSVTMPHKEAAARACDELTADAAALAAVNSVRRSDDGRLVGDSTDGEGFRRALVEAGHDPSGQRALVLGAGGAARSVVLALGRAGCDVAVAARRPEAAAEAAALAPGAAAIRWQDAGTAARSAALIVNGTPIGMAGDPALPLGASLPVGPGQVVADLIYHPLETPLLAAARKAGAATVDGLGMLVHQAALQVEGWTGQPAPVVEMALAARQELAARA
jgi:shikimate dehydrogenase